MSLIVSGIRLPFDVPAEAALEAARKRCGPTGRYALYRQSIDARHGHIYKVYSVCVEGVPEEERIEGLPNIRRRPTSLVPVPVGTRRLAHRPVVVGLGPAGLFAAYLLAKRGYRPLVLERGEPITQRDRAVDVFWKTGQLNPHSNLQFGEGGAGAYSDGKLTTRIGDARCDTVLQTFVRHGAPEEILHLAKPHIGTDILKNVVSSMRREIQRLGGTVCFGVQVQSLEIRGGVLCGVLTDGQPISCEQVVLAVGHSARDTFAALQVCGVAMEPKAFSVGARIEHLQSDIDHMLYGTFAGHPALPPAEYALSVREGERGCYSFCMCPGGQVVAAQSESETIVTNGMSYHARDGRNANAAIVVSVGPQDWTEEGPLGGIAFQRRIERAAWRVTGGPCAPCQRAADFLEDRATRALTGNVQPTYPLGVAPGRIDDCLPPQVTQMMRLGLRAFQRRMKGFAGEAAWLTAPETRTSSPIRLMRDGETLNSITVRGLLPCGEGAGYAGGIMSAAVDGLRAAEQIIRTFAPLEE